VGLVVGVLACFVRSKAVIITVAVTLALVLAYLAAMTPDPQTGQTYYGHIMSTGGLVGLIVGYATAKYSEKTQTATAN
jgi:hypothetical protein